MLRFKQPSFRQIVKHGGNLIPTYDPAIVTHIVTDAHKPPTLRALGCKRLSEIPDHIPTVKWSWILSAIGRTGRFDKEEIEIKMTEDVWLHAAFGERMDITTGRSKSTVSRCDRAIGGSATEAPNWWVSGVFNYYCRLTQYLTAPPANLLHFRLDQSFFQAVIRTRNLPVVEPPHFATPSFLHLPFPRTRKRKILQQPQELRPGKAVRIH